MTAGSFLLMQISYDFSMELVHVPMSPLTELFTDQPVGLWLFLLTLWTALILVVHRSNRKYLKETVNHDFTQRELDILKKLTSGDSNAVIAERLHISTGTVKNHVEHLLDKTGFKTRTELAVEARRLGIAIREND